MRCSPPVRMNRSGSGAPAERELAPRTPPRRSRRARARRPTRASRQRARRLRRCPSARRRRPRRQRHARVARPCALRPRRCARAGRRCSRGEIADEAQADAVARAARRPRARAPRRTVPSAARPRRRGRCQFSLENANSVSASTPRRAQPSTVARTALTPARCPGWRGSARRGGPAAVAVHDDGDVAWRDRTAPVCGCATAQTCISSFSFSREHLVDLRDVLVGELLHVFLGAAVVVLGDELFLQHFLEVVHDVAAHVADRDARVLAPRARTTLVRSRRRSSVSGGSGTRITVPAVVGVRPRSDFMIAFSIDRHHLLVPRHDGERARVLDGDVGHLLQRHFAAVVLDPDVLEQARAARGRCAASSVRCW